MTMHLKSVDVRFKRPANYDDDNDNSEQGNSKRPKLNIDELIKAREMNNQSFPKCNVEAERCQHDPFYCMLVRPDSEMVFVECDSDESIDEMDDPTRVHKYPILDKVIDDYLCYLERHYHPIADDLRVHQLFSTLRDPSTPHKIKIVDLCMLLAIDGEWKSVIASMYEEDPKKSFRGVDDFYRVCEKLPQWFEATFREPFGIENIVTFVDSLYDTIVRTYLNI